jgi:hypothetical protein
MECAFCGIHIDQENVGSALMDSDEPTIRCHGCNTKLKVTLEIADE